MRHSGWYVWLLAALLAVGHTSGSVTGHQDSTTGAGTLSQGDLADTLFVDATESSGLDFSHFNGSTGELLLPEITGSGGALLDYDNDGDLDLYIVQGAVLEDTTSRLASAAAAGTQFHDKLYRNDLEKPGGRVRFQDVTAESQIVAPGYGMGVATGDIDNDGWVDLYVTNLGPNQLWRNNGDGTFGEIGQLAGVDDDRWSSSASFLDYDRDGWLDLFVATYVDFAAAPGRECFSRASARDYCGPDAYAPQPDRLYRNRGNGTFEDVTTASGIADTFGAALGVVAADFNQDGWVDIFVANDGDANQLWLNNQAGGFADEALLTGVAFNHRGQAEASMGVSAEDYDGDGDEDLFVSNLEGESNTLYRNLGGGVFEDATIAAGLHGPSLPFTGFGTGFFDYDNDGRLDLVVLNGAVRLLDRQIREGVAHPLAQPNLLFRQNDSGRFDQLDSPTESLIARSEVTRGAAFGDVDNDGDVDLVVFNNSGPARVLLNQVGQQRHWVGIRAVEHGRDSLQTRIEIVDDSGNSQFRRVHTDGSYCSAGDPRVLIGLAGTGMGNDEATVQVRVTWPDGATDEFRLETDRYWLVRRGESPQPAETDR